MKRASPPKRKNGGQGGRYSAPPSGATRHSPPPLSPFALRVLTGTGKTPPVSDYRLTVLIWDYRVYGRPVWLSVIGRVGIDYFLPLEATRMTVDDMLVFER